MISRKLSDTLSKIGLILYLTPWRNGSASDSRSEGCVFKSRRGQLFFHLFEQNFDRLGLPNECQNMN